MDNYFNKIQDYFDGLLSEEDRQDFDNELAVNEELKEEVQAQKRINEVLSSRMQAAKGLNEMKSSLERSSKKHFDPSSSTIAGKNPSGKIFSLKNWSIAVGIAACFFIGLSLLGVFSSNLANLPALQSQVTRGGGNQTAISGAITSFNNRNYKESIKLFSELIKSNGKAARFQYYLGLSYIGDKNWNKAVEILIPVASGVSLYHEDAAYFTAIAAWKLKEKGLAIKYAKEVSESNKYYKKAQRLLKRMD